MLVSNFHYNSYIKYCDINANYECYEHTYRNDVATRLAIEIDRTYKIGGIGCTFVLTYNNEHLPTYNDRCVYNHEDIRIFLNRLKVYSRRRGLCAYKYFVCSEYGGKRGRSHYHILLFLSDSRDLSKYFFLVHSIWQNGHVLPFSSLAGIERCKLRNKAASASYVSKYVTKGIGYKKDSFIGEIRSLIKLSDLDTARKYRDMLPRLYQSNNMGMLEFSDFSDFLYRFEFGFMNPLRKKITPLPRYVINKYLYDNVPSFDGRLSALGARMYDRVLSVSDDDFSKFIHCKYKMRCDTFSNTIQLHYDELEEEVCKAIAAKKAIKEFDCYGFIETLASFDFNRNLTDNFPFVSLTSFFSLEFIAYAYCRQADNYDRYLSGDDYFSHKRFLDKYSREYLPIHNFCNCFSVLLSHIKELMLQDELYCISEQIKREDLFDRFRIKVYDDLYFLTE